jgi:hypothetical protein
MISTFSTKEKYGGFENIETKTKIQEEQRDFGYELLKNFYAVTEDYIKKYNVDIDLEEMSIDDFGNKVPTWRYDAGSIGKYHISNEDQKVGMNYHSDYVRETAEAPGYKFVITCTVYFNDDYEAGEIDFLMGDKLVKYKPEAGDLLVFPSGHPDYLTEDGKSYLHGVMPAYNKHKFLARLYWQKYQKGTDLWYAKEKEFGKTVWAEMQKEIHESFRQEHPQRSVIENGVRIR